MRKIMVAILIVLALALVGVLAGLWWQGAGASHGEILAAVREEGMLTRRQIDLRARETQEKLETIDRKLDRLLQIAERPLPDGMNVRRD